MFTKWVIMNQWIRVTSTYAQKHKRALEIQCLMGKQNNSKTLESAYYFLKPKENKQNEQNIICVWMHLE